MKRDTTELFAASLHLFGMFYENEPPPGCPPAAWDRLGESAERAHDYARRLAPDQTAGQRVDTIKQILSSARQVHAGLDVLPVTCPQRMRALRLLKTIVAELQTQLDDCGDPCWN